ncbi:MAG TPA: 1,4-alpha-glucan branching protein GlgB [Gammaproteobacteria bacterium]|nr:1,4-alpha-glucan branching protein GlgB [Gammaproteobacteria bacterium]
MDSSISEGASLLTDQDVYLFREGSHFRLYDKLGAHPLKRGGVEGVLFGVWAPNARQVSVLGEFNGWQPERHPLRRRRDATGIWEGFVPDIGPGTAYKYRIVGPQGYQADKGDPFARYWETPPQTASIVWDLDYEWGDEQWMAGRADANALDRPWSIYEVHAGSWRRPEGDGSGLLNWRELAEQLADYVHHMGYTHVELLPVMEHPFYGSWGYQSTGLFAPTARYGSPQDFMYLIDYLHQRGIGVILDWVPSHFPDDVHGLVYFDGTYLFEHADPKRGFQPDWHSYIYNYGRYEVRAFLISSALFWLDKYHVDGLRVDAVASMLYLDYGRKEGEWIPNQHGGRENLEAVSFLRTLNEAVYRDFPETQTIAEESTAWPMVSRPNYMGGLGFGMKWNMGWMHDTLGYMAQDPVYRKYHQDQLTFSIWYAFSENFVLPLSHDEVVYGKGSLLGRMPGDEWQKFANLRLLFGYMYAHPGKKLTFMGGEFGQRNEWNHEAPLDWDLLELDAHQGLQRWVRDLNHLYRQEPTLHQRDFDQSGFRWVDTCNWEQSVLSFLRCGSVAGEWMLVVCNFTPVVRHNYVVGVPAGGWWAESLNSDASGYGGSGVGNLGGVEAAPVGAQGFYHSLVVELPPLAMMFFKRAADGGRS